MKYIVLVFVVSLIYSCSSSDAKLSTASVAARAAAKDTTNFTMVQWLDTVVNVGNIPFGQMAEVTFKFKNTGTHPLFIIDAKPGCGCTVAEYPKQAIAPGAQGQIVAAFDTKKGHEGTFRKNINITTNTKGSTEYKLFLTGTITKKADKKAV